MKKIALVGNAKALSSFYSLFKSKKEKIEQISNKDLLLKYICIPESDQEDYKKYEIKKLKNLKNDLDNVILDPEIDIIIELNYDNKFNSEHILKALKNNKIVITTNRKIMAEKYSIITNIIKVNDAKIYYNSALAPLSIFKMIADLNMFDEISEFNAILNGTSNYVLSEMEDNTISMKETVEKAKELRYTEENPDIDLDGLDSLYKVILLADLFFEKEIDFTGIYPKGIKGITSYDIIYASELGYKIKLLASLKNKKDKILIGVRPNLIKKNDYLAEIEGNSSGIEIVFESGENFSQQGSNNKGKEIEKTILKDLISALKNIDKNLDCNEQNLDCKEENFDKKIIDLYSELNSAFYIRLQLKKEESIIEEIKDIFSEKDLADLILHDNFTETPLLPVIIVTKEINEKRLNDILNKIENLEGVLTINNIIPIKK